MYAFNMKFIKNIVIAILAVLLAAAVYYINNKPKIYDGTFVFSQIQGVE